MEPLVCDLICLPDTLACFSDAKVPVAEPSRATEDHRHLVETDQRHYGPFR